MRLIKFHGAIVLIWIIAFVYHEIIIPKYHATKCNWNSNPDNTNIMLVADPQLIDNHTYPGRNSAILKLSQHTVDVYLKKNYKSLVSHLNPQYIFFLGDLLDNGRSSDDDYFLSQLSRFKRVFGVDKLGYKQGQNLFTNLPGNHDIGIGDMVKMKSRQRFAKHFGELNTIKTINGVDIISLDSLSYLSNNDTINKDVNNFLDSNFGKENTNDMITKTRPRILLSHVPLYRNPQESTCGPLRESEKFLLTKGYQYQLVIDNERSNLLLKRIQPDLIYSGDDHDYCDITHTYSDLKSAHEITVKSVSMAMGIWYPAIQLLSFSNEKEGFNYHTDLCYLPTPYYNIITYIILAVITGILLLWNNFKYQSRSGYNILPLQTFNSKKINNLLDNHHSLDTSILPNYTFTKPKTLMSTIRTKCMRIKFPIQAFKQAILLGPLIIMIYLIICMII